MKKIALIVATLLITLTANANIHIVYGYDETHLLTLENGKSFRAHNKIDSIKGVFVYETMQKPKMIKFKTPEGKIIMISDTSSLLAFDEVFKITYSLVQLESSRKFVFVYNDEKGVNKNGENYYSGVLLPANKKLTLAYIMQYLGQVQNDFIIEHDGEIKAEQQRVIEKYNDSVYVAERTSLEFAKKQAKMQKLQSMMRIMGTIVNDPDILTGRILQKTYGSDGVIVDAKFTYTGDSATVKKNDLPGGDFNNQLPDMNDPYMPIR